MTPLIYLGILFGGYLLVGGKNEGEKIAHAQATYKKEVEIKAPESFDEAKKQSYFDACEKLADNTTTFSVDGSRQSVYYQCLIDQGFEIKLKKS